MTRKRHAEKALIVTDGTTHGGNYVEPLLKIGNQLEDLYGPGIQHIYIEHDDWCGIFKDKPCDCNPIVRFGIPDRMN